MFEWIRALDPSCVTDLAALQRDPNVYLVPTVENDAGLDEVLPALAEPLFVKELEAWSSDEASWPAVRDSAALRSWFRLARFNLVFDAVPDDPMFDDSEVLHAR